MVSDHDLRAALARRVEPLDPDVEAELERVLRRSHRRAWARRSAWVVGTAAVVAIVLALLANRLTPPGAEEPDPADEVPVRTLVPERGTMDNAAPVAPGRWRVEFLDYRGPEAAYLELEVPPGWGQDDDVSLSTGALADPGVRRLDLLADMTRVYRQPCASRALRVAADAEAQARALADMRGVRAGPVEEVTVDGHAGFRVSLTAPTSLRGRGGPDVPCQSGYGVLFKSLNWPYYVAVGHTAVIHLVEVDGHVLVILLVHDATNSEEELAELRRMIDTASIDTP